MYLFCFLSWNTENKLLNFSSIFTQTGKNIVPLENTHGS